MAGRRDGILDEPNSRPVCAPRLLAAGPALERPEDLRHHTLLHDFDYENWTLWLRAAGIDGVDPQRGLIIDDENVVLQATLEGQGVALGNVNLLAGDLAEGRLIRLFEQSIQDIGAYYVTFPPGALRRSKVKAFHDFLLEEAGVKGPDGATHGD